jgi:hypothetical protein
MGATCPEVSAAIGVHSGLACGVAMPSIFAAMRQVKTRLAARYIFDKVAGSRGTPYFLQPRLADVTPGTCVIVALFSLGGFENSAHVQEKSFDAIASHVTISSA